MSGIAAGTAAAAGPGAWAMAAVDGQRPAAGIHDVTRFGAIGDGKTMTTRALQRALDECGRRGGGTVIVPPGRYLTGALFLRSNLHLYLSAGATLLASERAEDFPPIQSRSEGIERKTHASLLTGEDLENVTLSGPGLLDGSGPPWWRAHDATRKLRLARGLLREADNPADAPLRWPRPRIINLIRCQGVTISGLSFANAPYWNLHLVYCQNVLVEGLTMTGLQAQNCDGVVIDSCKDVRVANCAIAAGSECIALKAGYNEDGRRVGIPCEDVAISNCQLSYSVGAAIAIGSETAGGIRNVLISNCQLSRSKIGVHVRSPRGRGGVVERIRVHNLVMDGIESSAIVVSTFFDSVRLMGLFGEGPSPKGNPETDRTIALPVNEGTPTLRDLSFSGLHIGAAAGVAVVEGLPERHVEGVSFRDVHVRTTKAGILCSRADDVSVEGLAINPGEGPAVSARHVRRLEVQGLRCVRGNPRVPLVVLAGVQDAFLHGCHVSQPGVELLRLEGSANGDVVTAANKLAPAPKPAG
jgi:polygalacturonase